MKPFKFKQTSTYQIDWFIYLTVFYVPSCHELQEHVHSVDRYVLSLAQIRHPYSYITVQSAVKWLLCLSPLNSRWGRCSLLPQRAKGCNGDITRQQFIQMVRRARINPKLGLMEWLWSPKLPGEQENQNSSSHVSAVWCWLSVCRCLRLILWVCVLLQM